MAGYKKQMIDRSIETEIIQQLWFEFEYLRILGSLLSFGWYTCVRNCNNNNYYEAVGGVLDLITTWHLNGM